jgi:4a-hydroxytetrahydrobiopterin dehydratase
MIAGLASEVPGWRIADDRLRRRFLFRDFVHAMRFVNGMAEVAEAEGHHPDFAVHYREVDVTVWTHAVGGLSENDFILAAKIDAVAERRGTGSVREG